MDHTTERDIIELTAGHLTAQRRAAVEAHLGECQACRELQARTYQAWQAMGTWTLDVPRVNLVARVDAAVRAAPIQAARYRAGSWIGWTARAAAGLLIGSGIGFAAGHLTRPAPSQPIGAVNTQSAIPDDATVAQWLHLASLDMHTPAGLAGALLSVPEAAEQEATQ